MTTHQRSMTVQDFRQACEQLWGPRFGVEAAAALGISVRAVHNYGTGRRPVPASMPGRIRAAALRHMSVLERVVAAMDEVIGAAAAHASAVTPEAAPAASFAPPDEADFPEGGAGEGGLESGHDEFEERDAVEASLADERADPEGDDWEDDV